MPSPLFASAFDALHPDIAERHIDSSLEGGAPSNQQIIEACRKHYDLHQAPIDSMANSSNSYAESGGGKAVIAKLNASNWKQPDVADASAVKGNGIFDKALKDAKADVMLTSILLGINADAQFIVGGSGGIGVAWDLLSREPATGIAYAMLKVGLQIDVAVNLMGGGFNALPKALASETFYGLTVYAGVGLGLQLNVFATKLTDLSFLGFSVGVGFGAGLGASVFAGNFYTFG